MRVTSIGSLPEPYRTTLSRRVIDTELVSSRRGDCLVMWHGDVPAALEAMATTDALHWVHTSNAGVPRELLDACEAQGITLTNGSGAHAPAIAEYVICAVLALEKRLARMLADQRARAWRPQRGLGELGGRTVGIIGVGSLGSACARVLQPFGARVVGISRSGQAVADIAEVRPSSELPSVLPLLDVLVIAAPLTPATRGLIGKAELALLPRGALVVNVGRGEILDEMALVEALSEGHVGGAALDVFVEEPLPEASAIWTAPNLIVSAHCADHTADTVRRGFDLFMLNLERWLEGQPLRKIVHPRLGY
jgi:phosphoglycerate dehydrogenase-like enzyme